MYKDVKDVKLPIDLEMDPFIWILWKDLDRM